MVWLPRLYDASGRIALLAAAVHDDRLASNMTADFFIDDEAVRTAADIRRHAEVMVETNLQRPRLERHAPIRHAFGRHAEMPLTKSGRSIALTFAQRCQRHAVRFDMQGCIRGQHLAVFDARSP